MMQKLCLIASHGCPPGLTLQQELAMVGCTITKVKNCFYFLLFGGSNLFMVSKGFFDANVDWHRWLRIWYQLSLSSWVCI